MEPLLLEDFDTCGDVRWGFPPLEAPQNQCWGFHGKECSSVKEPNLPSKGDVLSLLFSVLYSVQSHVNVLSGCLFHEPIIFTQSIFAFKFNIFRKLCSFWRFAQVHVVPWRKLTMKSHSTSSDCTGIILCQFFLKEKGKQHPQPSVSCAVFSPAL